MAEHRKQEENQAAENFEVVDEALRYYNSTYPDEDDFEYSEPDFSDYYEPSDDQKNGEMIYVGGGMLGLGYLVSKWF